MLGLDLIEKVLPILKNGEYLQNKEAVDSIVEALLQVKHFYTLIRYESQKSYLVQFIEKMEMKTIKKGEVLYDKGKANEGLYIIIQGEFSLWEPKSQSEINNEINLIEKIAKLQGSANQGNQTEEGKKKEQQAIIHLNFIRKKEDDELLRNQRKNNYFLTENVCALKRMRYLQIGDSLNEECVVSGAKTQYTALAQKDSVLLGISAKEYLNIFDLEISKLNFISEVLAKNFPNSKADSITRLAYKFKEELFPYSSMVFHQDDPSNLFMIIKTGLVEISKIKYPEIPGINAEDKESKTERNDKNNIQKVNTDEQIIKIKQEIINDKEKEKNIKIESETRNGSDPHLFLRKKGTKVTAIVTEEEKTVKEYQKYYGEKINNNNNNNNEEQQIEEDENEQQYIAEIAKQRDERNLEKGLMSPKKQKKQNKKRILQGSVLEPMKYSHGGQLIRLGIIGPGEVLGLDDFIKHRQRTYSAKSIAADTLVYYITRSKIDDIINLNEDYNLKKAMKDQANKKTDWHNNQQLNIARINQGIDGFSGMEDLSPNLYETKKQLQEAGNLDFKKVVQKLFDDRRTQLVETVIRKEINASPIRIKDFAAKLRSPKGDQNEGGEGKIKRSISDSDSAGTPGNNNNGDVDQEEDNNFFVITDSPRRRFRENSKELLSMQQLETVSQADSQSLSPTSILKNKRGSINKGSPLSRLGQLSPSKTQNNQNVKTVAFLDLLENNNHEIKREANEIVLHLFQSSSQQSRDKSPNKLRSQQSLWQFQEQYEKMEKETKQLNDKRKPSVCGGGISNTSIQQIPEVEYKNRFSTIFDEQPKSPDKTSTKYSNLGLIPENVSSSHIHLLPFNQVKSLPLSPQIMASKPLNSQMKMFEQIPQLKLNRPLDVPLKQEQEDQSKIQLDKPTLNTSNSQSLVRNYQNEAACLSLRQKILYRIQTNQTIASRYQKYNPESSQGFIEAKKYVRRLHLSRKGLTEPQPNPLQHSKEQHIIEVANFMSQMKRAQIDSMESRQIDEQGKEQNIQNDIKANIIGNNKNSDVIQEEVNSKETQNNQSQINTNNSVQPQQKHQKNLSDTVVLEKQSTIHKMPNIPKCLDALGSLFHVPYLESQQTTRSPALIRSLSPNFKEFKVTKQTNNKSTKHSSEHVQMSEGQFLDILPRLNQKNKSSINNTQQEKPQEVQIANSGKIVVKIQEVPSLQKDSSTVKNDNYDDRNENNERLINNLNDKNSNNVSQNLPFTLPSLVQSKTTAQLIKQSISPQISFSVKMSRKNIAHKFSEVFSSPQNNNYSTMLSPGHQITLPKNDSSSNVLSSSNSQIPLTERNNSSTKKTQENNSIIHFHSAQNSPSRSTKIINSNNNHQQTKDRLGEHTMFNPGKVLIAVSKLDTTEDIKLKIQQRQQRIFSKQQSVQEIIPSIAQRANNQANKIQDQATSPDLIISQQPPDNSHLFNNVIETKRNTVTTNRNISSNILSVVLPSPQSSRNSLKILNATKRDQRRNQLIATGNIALFDDKI